MQTVLRGPTPVCVYVLWHPKCQDGPVLAKSIYDWFHSSTEELHRSGLGLPVYYRSAPENEATGEQPRSISVKLARVNIIVPLVDDYMVASPDWRNYLSEIAEDVNDNQNEYSTSMYPVALSPSAYRLPPPIKHINFIRVDSQDSKKASANASREKLLRRRLTEVVARHLHAFVAGRYDERGHSASKPWRQANRPPPPLTVFLSHAKVDGREIAGRLREAVASYGQIRSFFDENDLPIGWRFDTILQEAIEHGTAAMIAVVTDNYSGRPWCREELRLCRLPRREIATSTRNGDIWYIYPVISVTAFAGQMTRGIPDLGNTSTLRWDEAAASEIIDHLMLEALLAAFLRLSAERISPSPGRHILTWIPDAPTLMGLKAQLDEGNDALAELVYPGFGLPEGEEREYRRFLGPNTRLMTFEDAAAPRGYDTLQAVPPVSAEKTTKKTTTKKKGRG